MRKRSDEDSKDSQLREKKITDGLMQNAIDTASQCEQEATNWLAGELSKNASSAAIDSANQLVSHCKHVRHHALNHGRENRTGSLGLFPVLTPASMATLGALYRQFQLRISETVDNWVRIDSVGDFDLERNRVGVHADDPKNDSVKRVQTNSTDAIQPRYTYFVRQSKLAEYISPKQLGKYVSRTENHG